MNPRDPLRKQLEQDLFKAMGKAADGYSNDDVVKAAANVLINAIRQQQATRKSAERMFDEVAGRSKAALLDLHYDAVTERRRNVFPFDQVVHVPLVRMKSKFHGM